MRSEIDIQSVESEPFATTVGRWLQLLQRAGKPSEKMKQARRSARAALVDAVAAQRPDLLSALAERSGAMAMEFVAQEGLAEAVPMLSSAGVDCNDSSKSSMGITPLIFAAQEGHTEAVLALLDCGADINQHGLGVNALGTAIRKQHFDTARAMLERIADTSQLQHMRGTLLSGIAEYGGAQFIPELVAKGLDPNHTDNSGKPPIAEAAQHSTVAVLQALLDAGASPDLPPAPSDLGEFAALTRCKDAPVLLAAKHGAEQAVQLLIDAGADLAATDHQGLNAYDWARKNGYRGITKLLKQAIGPSNELLDGHDLIIAAKHGDLATLKKAIDAGVDIDFHDSPYQGEYRTVGGRTALMHASIEGHNEAARMLIDGGASATATEVSGGRLTALEIAAGYDRPQILAYMLDNAEKVNQELLDSAVVEAARKGALDSLTFLLHLGANLDARDRTSHTPLKAAASRGQAKAIECLLDRGANLELRNDKDMFACTALHDALLGLSLSEATVDDAGNSVVKSIGEPAECVRLLLTGGADANAIPKHGDIPLQYANGNETVTKMLLDAGADVALTDKVYGQAALHWAVRNWDCESTKMILAAGASPSPVDKVGKTPLDLALRDNLIEIANLLEAAGGVVGMETEAGRAAVDAEYARELAEKKRQDAAAAADEALRPDFSTAANSTEYHQAIARFEKLTGAEPQTQDDLPGLVYCRTSKRDAETYVRDEREAFAELGVTLFQCGRIIGNMDEALIGMLPTVDPFEVIAAMGSSGCNYGIYMSEIVEELRELYELRKFVLSEVCYDTVHLELEKPLPKSKSQKWAVRLYELCPDVIDQGVGTITKLRQHLEKEKSLFLWWD